jgi:hypothetical protein
VGSLNFVARVAFVSGRKDDAPAPPGPRRHISPEHRAQINCVNAVAEGPSFLEPLCQVFSPWPNFELPFNTGDRVPV